MTAEKKKKLMKIGGIIGNVLIWTILVISILVTALVFAAQGSEDGIPALFGKSFLTIESPSMEPVFMEGDLVFMTKIDDAEKKELVKGDIITYFAPEDIDGDGNSPDINTHRIYEIDHELGTIKTLGDNNDGKVDNYTLGYNDVIGVCSEGGRVPFVGSAIKFLRSSMGFFLCVVLPLVLFFLYELYRFISILVTERAKKNLAAAGESTVSKETEEEIKRRAIEEYLRRQAAEKAASDTQNEPPETDEQSE